MRYALLFLCLPSLVHAQDNKALLARTGVELNVEFYSLPRVSQRLSIVNDVHVHGIYAGDYHGPAIDGAPNTNEKQLWAAPGGLAWSPKEQWRNATAAYIPAPVKVFRSSTKVKNSFGHYQDNAVLRWEFPNGTVFADLLVGRKGGVEYPFELRIRRKEGGEWKSEAYKPYADEAELPPGTKAVTVTASIDDAMKKREIQAWVLPDDAKLPSGPFKSSSLAIGGGFYPKHYYGALAACSACHRRAGESGDYAGLAAPGSDETVSFYPLTLKTLNTDRFPELSNKWPVEFKK